jgi:hypothetical protein
LAWICHGKALFSFLFPSFYKMSDTRVLAVVVLTFITAALTEHHDGDKKSLAQATECECARGQGGKCLSQEKLFNPCTLLLLLMHPGSIDYTGWKLAQTNQDQILRSIFRCIPPTNKFFVEFGFNEHSYTSGDSGANTHGLYLDGWRGLLLDGGNENRAINLHKHFLFYSNIAGLFEKYGVPKELDYLSIDMDSHDWFVGLGIFEAGYRPRVVSFEYNGNYLIPPELSEAPLSMFDPTYETKGAPPPGYAFTFTGCAWGASPAALELLARRYNYSRVAVDPPNDVFFVRDDLLPEGSAALRRGLPLYNSFASSRYYQGLLHRAQRNPANLRNLVHVGMLLEGRTVAEAKAAAYKIVRGISSRSPCWKNAWRRGKVDTPFKPPALRA